MPPGAHIETVAKQNGTYKLLANGRVRINASNARGEFVLDHEDAQYLYIVVYAPPASVAPFVTAPTPPVLSTGSVRDATGTIKLTYIGEGLPHRGEWREHFAVGDVIGDGSTQIVFGPARKSGGGPVAFREQANGSWVRAPLRVPVGRYDYGGVAIGDFDGDGRNDIALAMHLTGFSVLRATAEGTFERIDAGLPNHLTPLWGSGVAALALPARANKPAPLLLLQEPNSPPRSGAQRAPMFATYRFANHGFINEAFGVNIPAGSNIVFAPSSARCKAKLAVVAAALGAPVILESSEDDAWMVRSVEPFPDPYAVLGAAALGDLDGDRCSDFAVAYSSRVNSKWHSVVDVYLDRGNSWKRINLLDAARDAKVTAMTVAAHAGGALLLTLDDNGLLRGYRMVGDAAELVVELPAPEWRHGCSGSDIHALAQDRSGRLRIAASFAGEPTMGAFDRCRNGGGIEAWRIE